MQIAGTTSVVIVEPLGAFDVWMLRLNDLRQRWRRPIALGIPIVFFQINWWILALRRDLFQFFPSRFKMCIVMVFASLFAALTPEGGGAVAFPMMTLALGETPTVARDFALMIQSCALTSASFSIYVMNLQLEWNSIIYGSIAGVFGIIFGLEFVDKHIPGDLKKMGTVTIWLAFALVLLVTNLQKTRRTFPTIIDFSRWKLAVLLIAGFFGGIFTAIAGSGLGICMFSVLTLLFNVNEKIATPTSVLQMAINSVVGFYWRMNVMGQIDTISWEYFSVCIPIVVIFAPIGSLIATFFHMALIYFLNAVALSRFILAFVMVTPSVTLTAVTLAILFCGFCLFYGISRLGVVLGRRNDALNNDTIGNMQVVAVSSSVVVAPIAN